MQGRLHEIEGIGFPLLISPAYAVAGPRGAELLLAAIGALAFVLAALLARTLVPEPWATGAALLAGLSAPALAYGGAVMPELTAGALLAGAALCALSLRHEARPGPRSAAPHARRAALARAAVPLPALPVAWVSCAGRCGRGGASPACGAEVMVASLIFYVSLNDVLYGGFTPMRRGWAAARPPARTRSPTTWSARPASSRCGSIRRTGSCAGPRSSRWRSSRSGCCGARAASTSPARCRRAPRQRSRPG